MTVIINRALSRQLFQTDNAVGRQFRFGSLKRTGTPLHIVGVVEDTRYASVRDDKPPTMYLYYRHPPPMKNAATFEVRTAGPPSALAAVTREIVREIDPAMPVYGVMTQTDQIAVPVPLLRTPNELLQKPVERHCAGRGEHPTPPVNTGAPVGIRDELDTVIAPYLGEEVASRPEGPNGRAGPLRSRSERWLEGLLPTQDRIFRPSGPALGGSRSRWGSRRRTC